MNDENLSTNLDAITDDQLDTVSGGSLWGKVKHVAGAVGHSAQVVATDAVNGAKYGATAGGLIGAAAGPEAIPAGGAVGGVLGSAAGLGYGLGHEIGKAIKK
jgi:phage tail tape-measure protein